MPKKLKIVRGWVWPGLLLLMLAVLLATFGADASWLSASTGLLTIRVLAGLFSSLALGRIGLGVKPPPQLGHTFMSKVSTQALQNVHSKLQIMASVESGGSALPQASQLGRSSSTAATVRSDGSLTIPVIVNVTQSLSLLYGSCAQLRFQHV